MEIKSFKNKLFSLEDLTSDESMDLFELIMTGKLNEIDITAILTSLKIKGETKDEILGATKIMRSKSMKISSSVNTVWSLWWVHNFSRDGSFDSYIHIDC